MRLERDCSRVTYLGAGVRNGGGVQDGLSPLFTTSTLAAAAVLGATHRWRQAGVQQLAAGGWRGAHGSQTGDDDNQVHTWVMVTKNDSLGG